MIKGFKIGITISFVITIIFACSTEKNTLLSRSYHGLNAHYNGYFNANYLIDQAMITYRTSAEEDYYSILPIDLVPDEEEVIGMYPAIDTAIAKCTKVIVNHSMPSNDRPAHKTDEHNSWIDENWTTVGIASYYRRDYEGAMKNFRYVRKFYTNDPSLYIGELWMAKTHIAQGQLTKAKFNLDNLDKAVADEKSRKKEKSSKSKSKRKKSKKKEDKIAKFPKRIRFDLEKTKAALALKRGNKEDAIKFLEESLKFAKKSSDKARVHFILGQLYEEEGQNNLAVEHYSKVLKSNARYQMSFNARLKKAFLGNGEKTMKELKKMLRDAKNAKYKDQIYYAMAGIELQNGNETLGIEYLHQSAFYSTNNTRQKGMAYEKLGDMSFDKRNYVSAQKYYDSCATVIEDTYPNAEGIRNKATNLASLVVAVETAQYEDSVQRIAMMGEDQREDYLKDLIKKIKDEEQQRKERDARRLRELQANENLFVQSGSGSKWYWNNAKTRAEGYQEFKKLWGVRENEDHWRRSDKVVMSSFNDLETEDIVGEDTVAVVQVEDTLTVESLSSLLPLSDSAMAESNMRLLEAHYNAGVIYKDQLNEREIARGEFEAVLDRNVENKHNLLAAFQLYQISTEDGSSDAMKYRKYILDNYPNSGYANYLMDPNYFVKKKEQDKLAEQVYVTVLDRYDRGLYYPVITKADMVIENEKDNIFRSKYMLLKALCLGQINEDKEELLPTLYAVLDEYAGTPEAAKANEMIGIIKNGYSKNEPVDFGSKFPFAYEDRVKLMVIVFPQENENANMAKAKIVDFQREFFSKDKIKVTSKVFGGDKTIILISDFATESDASEYIRVYKKTRKYLLDLQNAKIFMITEKNLKVLFEKQNLEVYENFYDEYY